VVSVGERRVMVAFAVLVVGVEVVEPAVPSTMMGNICEEPSGARVGWMS